MATASTPVDQGHEKSRNRVCAICYRKGNRSLSARDVESIRMYAIDGYSKENSDLPCGLCNSCYILLSKRRNGEEELQLPIASDYNPQRPMNMRSLSDCYCRICVVSSSKNQSALKFKKKSGRPPLPLQESSTDEKPAVFKICSHCFSKIYRGSDHSANMCTSRRQKVYNIEKLIEDDAVTRQRLASRTINSFDSPLATLGSRHKQINSSNDGHKLTIKSVSNIQTDLNLSVRQVHLLAKDLRKESSSRKFIEPGLKKEIYNINHKLDDHYELRLLQYTNSQNENFDRWTVVCSDLSVFVDYVISTRNLDTSDMILKIGLDGGSGFLKMTLSVFNFCDSDNSKFKDSGVRKCFLIGIAPDVPENYFNVKRLWLNIGIDDLHRPYTVSADLKLCNILMGLMAHGSLHPCCWCNIPKNELSKRGELRTLSSLRHLFWTFFNSGATKSKAKEYGNVIHPPILHNANDSIPVLDLIPPPELHLLSGPVNTLFSGMKDLFPNESNTWLTACQVKQDGLHGGSFTGNASRKLLRSVHILADIAPAECRKFVTAFRELNSVVESCYGYELHDDYKDHISRFHEAYLQTGLSVTPKIHAVSYHIVDFCSFKGRGLGAWSEQVSEAVHHQFEMTWQKFRINDVNHPNYGRQLLAAVRMFNSKHV